ncbi:MAG: hypothetical protein ACTSRP_15580 [Candidatus Helarchaeota archaeon]
MSKDTSKTVHTIELKNLDELRLLDEIASEIIKIKNKKNEISIIELVSDLKVGIYTIKKALAYYEWVLNEYKLDTSDRQQLNRIDKMCQKVFKTGIEWEKKLNIQNLVINFNFGILDSQKIIQYYNLPISIKNVLRYDIRKFDKMSIKLIKYLVEENRQPSIGELVNKLEISIRDAKLAIPFINMVVSSSFDFKFNYDKELDAIAVKILRKIKDKIGKELDLINLAYETETGIYTLKNAIGYYQWVISEVSIKNIETLSNEKLQNLDRDATNILKYFYDNKIPLNLISIITNLDYELYRAKEILSYYELISKKVFNFDEIPSEEKNIIDNNARIIYNAAQKNQISSYNIQEVISILNMGFLEAWKAIQYLKVKIIPDLSITESPIIHIKSKLNIAQKHINFEASTPTVKNISLDISSQMVKIEDKIYDLEQLTEKIEVKREYDYIGGLIRFKVVIKNNSGININNIDIQLRMPEHIRIIRIVPKVYSKGNNAFIPNMQYKQSQSIDFYLEPLICGTIPVEILVIYQDAFGKSHSIIREAKTITTKCPPIINPGEENVAKVENLISNILKAKQKKCFKIHRDPSYIFEIFREILNSWVGTEVIKPIVQKEPTFKGIAYYFILSKNIDPVLKKREQIAIKLEVLEKDNITSITVACERPETACGVLTYISELCEQKFVEIFNTHLKSIWCPECGAPISKLPKKSKKIICYACNTTFALEGLT